MDHPRETTIDGVRYRQVDEFGPIKIVVLERGFIYVGRTEPANEEITIHGARSLIRWGTSHHLGELHDGPLKDTKLGASCTVRARLDQLIHTIEVSQDAWSKHITG